MIVEDKNLNYLIHGDVTYTDEALYMNKFSIATEDKKSARETLNKVREFIKNNPTIYVCGICGYVYDPTENNGVAFEDLPADWKCPRCRQSKDKFNKA